MSDDIIREYYVDNKLHREDGPAYIAYDGPERWYLKGKWIISSREFCKMLRMTEENTCIFLLKHGESLLSSRDNLLEHERLKNRMEREAERMQTETDVMIMDYLISMLNEQFDAYSEQCGFKSKADKVEYDDPNVDSIIEAVLFSQLNA